MIYIKTFATVGRTPGASERWSRLPGRWHRRRCRGGDQGHLGKSAPPFNGLVAGLGRARRALPSGLVRRLRDLHAAATVLRDFSDIAYRNTMDRLKEALAALGPSPAESSQEAPDRCGGQEEDGAGRGPRKQRRTSASGLAHPCPLCGGPWVPLAPLG